MCTRSDQRSRQSLRRWGQSLQALQSSTDLRLVVLDSMPFVQNAVSPRVGALEPALFPFEGIVGGDDNVDSVVIGDLLLELFKH